jgi:hypothetical protein
MNALDRLIPRPALLELDGVDVAAPAGEAWEALRHGDLGRSALSRALFSLRTLPGRLVGRTPARVALRIDDLGSTPARPGFQVLHDEPPAEVVVGAIGKVWRLAIPFVHVADADRYAAFASPGFVRVAWAIRVAPKGHDRSRVELEVRADATDPASWRKFRLYFALVGPWSRWIRRSLLSSLARQECAPSLGVAQPLRR